MRLRRPRSIFVMYKSHTVYAFVSSIWVHRHTKGEENWGQLRKVRIVDGQESWNQRQSHIGILTSSPRSIRRLKIWLKGGYKSNFGPKDDLWAFNGAEVGWILCMIVYTNTTITRSSLVKQSMINQKQNNCNKHQLCIKLGDTTSNSNTTTQH